MDLRSAADRWLSDDPDPASRDELRAAIASGNEADLADRFAGPLRFGTAGLRGPLRAGPNGMNRAVVRQAAAGLVAWLAARGVEGPLVIGFDARHGSREFAAETARVATGAKRAALVLPRPLPTPVLAYAVRTVGAAAGVMVTASHNPPQDNGYKVYLADGAQLVPPADAEIEAAIRAVGRLSEVPLGDEGEVVPESLIEAYVAAVAALVGDGPRALTVSYTPLHGVGAPVLAAALEKAGFAAPATVPEQAEPDPDFPTVAFPNPEEPGAMDLVTALASKTGADLAIANDPDADRCAVAIPAGSAGTAGSAGEGWRMLRGDEVGALLADHLMRRGAAGRYATTIVSSALLKALCAARGHAYGETLTGFKWIVRAGADLVFGYEEALGYCVAPSLVLDKDGISAALLVCELAAGLKAEGRTLADRLDDLAREFGVYATDQLSVRVTDLADITRAMARIRRRPPASLLDEPVSDTDDLLPDADVLTLRTASARAVVRPSGTEPKLKAYLEVVEDVVDGDVPAARERASAALSALRAEVAAALGLISP
ncbi:phospho-sugar mutase [Virgisporangium aurantiacum]|uniref:Phosphomannomutase n=1 Tax=Virgisporangium aurantiacum TaxID=175570 RepID=A0A8J4DX48_9ACTN|nr:phospho-sugar mutase [Virgisporangium aurantiacum]GIJ53559.1 phosphomannomutase [Virgisporangium aurantiacum]